MQQHENCSSSWQPLLFNCRCSQQSHLPRISGYCSTAWTSAGWHSQQFTVYSFYASRNILLVHKLKERKNRP